MTRQDIVRAWKDEEYRAGLAPAELARLPAHPAGPAELADTHLEAAGGRPPINTGPMPCHTAVHPCGTQACSLKCPSQVHSTCRVC